MSLRLRTILKGEGNGDFGGGRCLVVPKGVQVTVGQIQLETEKTDAEDWHPEFGLRMAVDFDGKGARVFNSTSLRKALATRPNTRL